MLLGVRDAERARVAADELSQETSGVVRPVALDVSDPESIAAARVQIGADPGRLDVLVNNAGVGLDFGVSGLEPDFEVMEKTLQTNFYGAYRTALAMLDLLRASEHPRIVNVSSGMGGVSGMGGWSPGYRVSKASMNAMTRILSTELASEGVLVNSACPGFVASDMGTPMGASKSLEDRGVGGRLAGDPAGRWPPEGSSATGSRSPSEGARAGASRPRRGAAHRGSLSEPFSART